ncbi:MAG: M15 family metallopeptidase [Candidatus Saccharibacteria bacterium]|nr:M15 family metallopeptidase [Candidatus Saccharibacteria bacterium]
MSMFVSINDPRIILDLRYTTTNNIANKIISNIKELRLEKNAGSMLIVAVNKLYEAGYKLVIWDSYRSEATQSELRLVCSDDNFVALYSNHCLGLAIDVTLADVKGKLLDMGTDFDDFISKANSNARNVSQLVKNNRKILKDAMESNGFEQDKHEWWHFDFCTSNPVLEKSEL